MSERVDLIKKWKSGHYSMTELAEEYGVSRPTVYEWTGRYEEFGEAGLESRRSVPKSCPHRTDEKIGEKIVQAKREHPHWGPAKLIELLKIEQPEVVWPSASTAGAILNKEGLVQRRRKKRSGVVRQGRRLEASESGEMMTVDHKGQFRLGDGRYCFPVTINDPVSRYSYAITGTGSTSYGPVKKAFERVFEAHGVPDLIGSDNGTPFSCVRALGGLSALSVWWIKLGITPMRIHPGCPWENGTHERMHRTLKAETARPPAKNQREQQKRFDAFRKEFNSIRPHAGLGGRRPADLLRACRRPYPRRLPEVEYPAHYERRSVRLRGLIKWQGQLLFLSKSLVGEQVGLVEIDNGIWSIYFGMIELGRYDERTRDIE